MAESSVKLVIKKPRAPADHIRELREEFRKIPSRNGEPLSESTIVNYANKLSRVCRLVTGEDYSGSIEFLNDPQSVIDRVEGSGLGSKKDYLSPVAKFLKSRGAPSDIITQYQAAMTTFKNEQYQKRNENKATEKEKDNALPMSDILKYLEPDAETSGQLQSKLICQLYFQNTVVPRNDLPLFRLMNARKKLKPDASHNYITILDGVPKEIIMNTYKTSRTYGRQKFPIVGPLKLTLMQYINAFGRKPGDYLFQTAGGHPYEKDNFRKLIAQSTLDWLGKPMNVDLIRSIIISDYYNHGPHSIAEDKEEARKFLHSESVHKEYMKLDLHGAERPDSPAEEEELD